MLSRVKTGRRNDLEDRNIAFMTLAVPRYSSPPKTKEQFRESYIVFGLENWNLRIALPNIPTNFPFILLFSCNRAEHPQCANGVRRLCPGLS